MSGLYNVVFGSNPLAGSLLKILGIDYKAVPRFRDCFLNEAGTEIIIYTRTGGGNRPDFEVENQKLREVSGFKGDEDDSYDATYALFRYDIPEEQKNKCLIAGYIYGVDPAKRWKETLENLKREAQEKGHET